MISVWRGENWAEPMAWRPLGARHKALLLHKKLVGFP